MVEQGILEILSFAMKLIIDCENVILMLDDIKFEISMDPTHCKDGNLASLEWKIINEIWPLLIRGPEKWAKQNMVPNKEFDIDFKFENTGDISAKIEMNGKFTLSKLAELSSLLPELIEVSTYLLNSNDDNFCIKPKGPSINDVSSEGEGKGPPSKPIYYIRGPI